MDGRIYHVLLHCQKLEQINDYLVKNGQKGIKLEKKYQNFIYKELISCVKLHQRLIYFANRINDLVHTPIFMFTFSGVVVGVALIYFLKSSIQYITTSLVLSLITLIISTTLIMTGQLLVDETENIYVSLTNLPWYSLNVQNRRVVFAMLIQSQKNIQMSASGLISLNYQVTIVLFRCIYGAITFLVNMGL
ncbi:odorant receptor 85b-like [Tribolium madens]|uniref:odorant receptor 85b-like n=1 Tax=Tribolium madens TaxID=41895 RepID=UPI001CF765A9|nr:odorant receptor 85b-like [Tribolium madens]